ncbi:hypothetical protein ACFWTE_11635 [Nocardiopsis sp. NPDC058631]|uniref:hypothetical protein n=1 Tax=Nocardiopsis sp. NPDC058631 TaxID=3346566 RepID=UPI003648E634
MSRSHALRRLAADLSTEHPGCRAHAEYDTSYREWTLAWTDGPTDDTVRERLPVGEAIDLRRSYTHRALAVAAIELSLSGDLGKVGRRDRWTLQNALTVHLAARTDPHATDGRTGALADALLDHLGQQHPDPSEIAAAARGGVAHLLRQPSADAAGEGDGDPLVMGPAEYLTSRYAKGQAALDWRDRLATAPAAELVAELVAATADEHLDAAGHLAVLALLGQMRADLDRLEDAALTRAHAAGASWARIGAVLGITKQSAHTRAKRRASGRPTRSSPQS